MTLTAVEWLIEQLENHNGVTRAGFENVIQHAKQMEKNQSQVYAEFAIRCDRMDMKILNFEDWIKLKLKEI